MLQYAGPPNMCWNDGASSSQPTVTSNEKPNQHVDSVQRGREQQHQHGIFRIDESNFNRVKIDDSCQKLVNQLPLQMHPGHHLVYQSYSHQPDLSRSPDGRHSGNLAAVARYLPVQQHP